MNTNGAQIHLLLNHFPVVGFPIVLFALLWGLLRHQNQVFLFGAYLTILVWATTLASYLTGEDAEDVLKELPSFNSKQLIHTHEDTALWAMILSSVLAVVALLMLPGIVKLLPQLQNPKFQKSLRWALVVGVVAVSGILALAAHQGGLIVHTEIR